MKCTLGVLISSKEKLFKYHCDHFGIDDLLVMGVSRLAVAKVYWFHPGRQSGTAPVILVHLHPPLARFTLFMPIASIFLQVEHEFIGICQDRFHL